jgi:MATE family multidrug resistance protein
VLQAVATAATVLAVLAVSLPGDGMNCVLGGVLRGAGRQGLGAALNVVTYWCLGLPLSWLLAFRAKLGIVGLWAGLAVTTTVQVRGTR